MGLGDSPLGTAPLGLDPPAASAARAVQQPAALKVDGQTKDYVLDAQGRFVGVHPVDAKVFHRLRILSGSIRSAPTTGQGIGALKYIDKATIDAFVRDQITLALSDMVAGGDIAVRAITVDASVAGRVVFQVDYTNLRTGRSDSFRST